MSCPMADNDRGENLREWRERRELTQEELAAIAFLSRSAIQGLESGRSTGRKGTWRRLAQVLDVDLAALWAPRPPDDPAADAQRAG